MTAPKRFYQDATVTEEGGAYAVMLDARRLKTPAGAAFALPSQKLARLVAEEWNAQGDEILHITMPITRLVFTAIDRTPDTRAALIEHLSHYGETDLVCHQSHAPAPLATRQSAAWEPWRTWGEAQFGVAFPVVESLAPAQGAEARRAAVAAKAADLENFALTGLAHAVSLCGSAILGLALAEGRLDAKTAFDAAALDDLWSLETWGEDHEARARLYTMKREIEALARYFEALA